MSASSFGMQLSIHWMITRLETMFCLSLPPVVKTNNPEKLATDTGRRQTIQRNWQQTQDKDKQYRETDNRHRTKTNNTKTHQYTQKNKQKPYPDKPDSATS
jgi:hypothetical protein